MTLERFSTVKARLVLVKNREAVGIQQPGPHPATWERSNPSGRFWCRSRVLLGLVGRAPVASTPGLAHSTERAPVALHLDGIVQVLNCHLSDMAIGMMTRIAVLKWLYHLYIKTPRKVSPEVHGPSRSLQARGLFHSHLAFQGPARAWWGLDH